MKITGNSFEEFHNVARQKKIIAFGASDFLRVISLNYKDLQLDNYVSCVADNDVKKQGRYIVINGSPKEIVAPSVVQKCDKNRFAVLITSAVHAYEIYMQLEELLGEKNMDVFVLSLMVAKRVDDITDRNLLIKCGGEAKIPKIIHYFWFSGEEKDTMTLNCIESWKKACPDYELIEWNSDNYDVTINSFAYEAYKQKKWAYVSDYARLDIVYRYGGVYLDLDVILFKNIDVLLKNEFFIGFGPIRDMEAAIFGAQKESAFVKGMLDMYKKMKFDINSSMTLPNLQPLLLDRYFEEKGFEINGRYQEKNGIVVYPRDLFSSKNWFTGRYEMTDTSLGIHECAGGWVGKSGKSSKQIKAEENKKLEEVYFGQNEGIML